MRLGSIGFSRTYNCITWFGVSSKYKQKGVGSKLLCTALNQLNNKKLITVETFQEGFGPGLPAKNLYGKFGFVETESDLTGPFDLPICRIKINYETHCSSMPHLHTHLFPRYLDDDFASAPIDYRITEPYESDEEYNWLVEQMRKQLANEKQD